MSNLELTLAATLFGMLMVEFPGTETKGAKDDHSKDDDCRPKYPSTSKMTFSFRR